MAVAHSGETNQTANFSGVNSFSITNQTSAGSDRIGICHVGGFLGASGSTSATWGGSAMTVTKLSSGGDAIMLHYVAPATSTSTVTVSNLNAAVGQGAASTYTGADQSAGSGPISNTAEGSATAVSPASVTVTTSSGEMVVDACGIAVGGSPAEGANQNVILNTTASNGNADCLASYQLGADGGVMSWTYTGSRYWDMVAASIKSSVAKTAALTGTATSSITESDIVSGGKTVILTLTGETYVSGSIVTPVIESGDATVTTIGAAADPWSINRPTGSTGDLMVFIIAWDDSTTVSSVAAPSGPNGETINSIVGPVASNSTEMRMQAWYTVATGSWSAGTLSFNPSASETCRAVAFRVPAGEFDASTPIGASSTSASSGTAESNINSPAFSAGASDGDGRLVIGFGSDADAITPPASGTGTVNNATGGGVGLCVSTRNTAVSDSESISAITATIASDSWATLAFVVRAPTATPFDSARQAMIDGLDSAQSEANGWDAEVKAKQGVSGVVRTSDTVVTITLDAQAAYDITAQETITATIPGSILTGASPIVASPTFTVDTSGGAPADPEGGLIGGKLLHGGLLMRGVLIG